MARFSGNEVSGQTKKHRQYGMIETVNVGSNQGVSYSQKFRGKRSFPNLVNTRTSQFIFPKY